MIRLYGDKIEQVTALIAEAMFYDPLNMYWFPDERNRLKNLVTMYRPEMKYCLRHGEVYAVSERMEGAALWLTNTGKPHIADIIVHEGGLGLLFKFPCGVLKSMNGYEKFSRGIRNKFAPVPHLYLHNIAVKKSCQGKGFAGGLLRPILSRAAGDGIPCYLETQNPDNVPLYEHYGFKVVDESPVPGSKTVLNWAMLKEP